MEDQNRTEGVYIYIEREVQVQTFVMQPCEHPLRSVRFKWTCRIYTGLSCQVSLSLLVRYYLYSIFIPFFCFSLSRIRISSSFILFTCVIGLLLCFLFHPTVFDFCFSVCILFFFLFFFGFLLNFIVFYLLLCLIFVLIWFFLLVFQFVSTFFNCYSISHIRFDFF